MRGVRDGGASEHHGVDARFQHGLESFLVVYSAVAGNGDVRALDEFREEVEVDGSAVHLRCEAGVKG